MKYLFNIGVLALSFILFSSQAPISDIEQAFKNGNVEELSKYFDSSVDITLNNTSETYSKSQAEQVLKSFFSKNKVTHFKQVHSVSSRSGSSESFVGQMTAGGQHYRVFLLLASSGSQQVIQEISIRKK